MLYKYFISISIFIFTFLPSGKAQKLNRKEKKQIKYAQSVVKFLASDRLEGRATGSDGEKLAVDYISNQFKKLAIGAYEEDNYIQKFEIITLRIASGECYIKTDSQNFEVFKSFYPLSYSNNSSDIKAELVDIAYGIPYTETYKKGYKKKNVLGKICLVNISSPDGIHPHSKHLAWHGIQKRVDELASQGAKCVIFHSFDGQMSKPQGHLKKIKKTSSIPVLFIEDSDLHDCIGQEIQVNVKILTQKGFGNNVVAFVDNKAKNTVVIGAHHDHLGYGEISGAYPSNSGKIHNGADDNASGVAGLLLLAKKLKENKKAKRNNYLFITFSGEEMGLLGSKFFAENTSFPLEKINYMFNFDMIGKLRKSPNTLVVNGVGTSLNFDFWQDSSKYKKLGFDKVKVTKSGIGASDHSSFYLKNIPVLHFFTGQHGDYHKPEDDYEKLNYYGIVKIVNFVEDWIEDLNKKGKINFQKTKSEQSAKMRFPVTLGIMPDYVFDGEGLRIDGITEGKPAHKAGIKAGDILVNLDGKMITNIQDYMKILSSLKKGQKTEGAVKRKDKVIGISVQF